MSGTASAVVASVEAIATAALTAPSVASLHTGRWFQYLTLLPGRRVEGVRLDDDRVEVGVVAAFGVPLIVVADQVRRVVGPLAGGRAIDVHVCDLQLPEDQPLALPSAEPA